MATILDIHQRELHGISPFPNVAPTPAEHFRLAWFTAVAVVWEQVVHACQGASEALAEFPFLQNYADQLCVAAGRESQLAVWWLDAVRRWEDQATVHLPIRELRAAAALDDETLAFLFAVGLAEEDPSFGVLFEVAQARPGVRRPTAGLLHAWWRNAFPDRDSRAMGRQLLEPGLLRQVDAGPAGAGTAFEVPAAVWDGLRGSSRSRPFPGGVFIEREHLPSLDGLVLPDGVRNQLDRVCTLLASGEIDTLVIRGPRRNGRETMLRAVARGMNRAALVLDPSGAGEHLEAHAPGPLATMLGAFPILRYDLAAGELAKLPALNGYRGGVGILIGQYGGLDGERMDRQFTIDLGLPDYATRIRHWAQVADGSMGIDIDDAARHLRLTSGNLRRVAAMAPGYARLDGRSIVCRDDVRRSNSALNRQALDTLATWLPPVEDMTHLAVRGETRAELGYLLRRCRYRDELHQALGPAFAAQGSHGVRALFAGPSGTGKTFAARLVAAELGVDLYRVDLSAIVDKYIGETEKNLGRLFAHAEELDVMLLLDEGDALLGERSAVNSATDRYANLETNFLLQRLETFAGLLVITTNASDRIDKAFERRMDVVVSFQLPEPAERAAIWRSHLPAQRRLPERLLDAAAHAYKLSGGQIRNAALHAGLLALDDGGVVTAVHLDEAIQREYRKLGRIAPALDPRELAGGFGDG